MDNYSRFAFRDMLSHYEQNPSEGFCLEVEIEETELRKLATLTPTPGSPRCVEVGQEKASIEDVLAFFCVVGGLACRRKHDIVVVDNDEPDSTYLFPAEFFVDYADSPLEGCLEFWGALFDCYEENKGVRPEKVSITIQGIPVNCVLH